MRNSWRVILENPRYSVSSTGRVRNNKTGRILKHRYDSRGYDRVNLQGKDFKVHRLVALNFELPKQQGENQVNHIDGNPRNNDISNLEWCTNQQNANHAFRIGMRNHLLSISDDDVCYIRDNKLNYKDVMEKFGVSQSHASAIVNNTRRVVVNESTDETKADGRECA